MATAFDEDTNERLRSLAKSLKDNRFQGRQNRLAEAMDLTPGFISEFLNGSKGAGLELLVGLGRLAPLELLEMLRIDPRLIVNLVKERGEDGTGEESDVVIPDAVRRAMRAAIEVTACSPTQVYDKTLEALEQHGEVHLDDPEWWLTKILKRIGDQPKSGERPSVKLKKADKS